MDWIRDWVEGSGYTKALGVVVADIDERGVRLDLPYQEANSNPGQALHGGCAASLAIAAAGAVTRAAMGEEAGPFHTAGVQINYLAAAIGEPVHAQGTLLRRGKNMSFVEVDVQTDEGKSIAHATAMVRCRFGAESAELPLATGDDGTSEPGKMGPGVGKMPFTKARGLLVEHMAGGTSRLTIPMSADNSDRAGADGGGGVHEGALLALLDTTGAMAAWGRTGFGPYKASTPSLQAQILAPPGKQDLIAYGRVVHQDADGFWSDVEVAGQGDGRTIARGTVLYRIVT